MDLRHVGSIALFAIMVVAALFFFPATHGSYSATHGPITALRSHRLRAFLMFALAAAAAALAAVLPVLIPLDPVGNELSSGPRVGTVFDAAPLRC